MRPSDDCKLVLFKLFGHAAVTDQPLLCHRHSNVRWLQTRKETSFDRIEEQTRGKKYHFEKRATDGAQNKRKLRIKSFY